MSPQPRVTKTTASKNGLPVGDVTPEEAAVIRAKISSKEQAPSSQVQALFSNWRDVADQLGSPFEVERIAISKLRAMRRDPMLGFGLSFIKTPHVRAKWFINARDKKGPNAQVAAHLDADLRRIYASLVMQYMNKLDFGFQASTKRFEFRVPGGTYIDTDSKTGEQTERPIWKNGAIQPIAWKPFTPLRPEAVNPIWNNDGEFDGIDYDASRVIGYQGGTGNPNYKIDLEHSLWVTNEKEGAFGSIFGYPRLGYAFRYWWSYWFRWAIADRAFERKADPSVVVRYPDGKFVDETTGEEVSYQDYALEMGARMRSGGVIALPSEPYEDANGRGTIPMWDLEFTKDSVNFDPFDKSFEYLDVQKLRSLFIPEQAFLEGKGGTSSRNVAAEMGQSFLESQAALSADFTFMVNRFVIPQWLAINYPEFISNNGTAELVIQGFLDEDTAFMQQVIQLLGQDPNGAQEIFKLVDLQKMLEDRGTPVVSYTEQQRRAAEIVNQQQTASAPGATAPVPGQQVGVVPTATGFSYIQPREIIYLSDTASAFTNDLPQTSQFSNKSIRKNATTLWNVAGEILRDEYKSAVAHLGEEGPYVSSPNWADAIARFADIDTEVANTAAVIEADRSKVELSDFTPDWIDEHVARASAQLMEDVRNEITGFIDEKIAEGLTEDGLRAACEEQFAVHMSWRPSLFARTLISETYNRATISAARASGSDRVQRSDGSILSVDDALALTLYDGDWKIVPSDLKIESLEVDGGAIWDDETCTLSLSDSLSDEAKNKILKSVMEDLQT